MATKTKPAAQVPFAKKAAALKARISPKTRYLADAAKVLEQKAAEQFGYYQHDTQRVHAPRAPPDTRLLSRPEVVKIVGVSFQSLWAWMRAGTFPRSRIVGGRSMWLSSEIDGWLADLPVRPLKGDSTEENTAA